MSAKIIPIGCVTTLDLPPDRVISEAVGRCDGGAVVIGFDEDGEMYFASSIADGGTVLWLMELAKKRLMEVDEA